MYGIYIQKNPTGDILGWLKCADDWTKVKAFDTYWEAFQFYVTHDTIRHYAKDGVEYVIKEYDPEIKLGQGKEAFDPANLHGKLQRLPDRRIGTRDRRAAQDRRQSFYMPF